MPVSIHASPVVFKHFEEVLDQQKLGVKATEVGPGVFCIFCAVLDDACC